MCSASGRYRMIALEVDDMDGAPAYLKGKSF